MPEDKTTFPLRLTEEERTMVQEWTAKDGSRSQNEFIRKAIRFYAGYLSGNEATDYLSAVLTKRVQAPLKDAEGHIGRMLYKLAVEHSMMMRILAYAVDLYPDTLRDLRAEAVNDIKRTNGQITFRDMMQREWESPLQQEDKE